MAALWDTGGNVEQKERKLFKGTLCVLQLRLFKIYPKRLTGKPNK